MDWTARTTPFDILATWHWFTSTIYRPQWSALPTKLNLSPKEKQVIEIAIFFRYDFPFCPFRNCFTVKLNTMTHSYVSFKMYIWVR